ncbi:MAG: GNAT family N-acetyltransferase [Chloroflexota bacterium]|nr:GNAT family N-acetyltransferase [Chloroflexota bacterium]
MTCSSAQIETGTFESLAFEWQNIIQERLDSTFFDQQVWHKTWWSEFGNDFQLKVLAVYSDTGSVALIAPLMVDGSEISFLGSTDLVDYHDFLIKEPSDVNCIQSLMEVIHGMTEINKISLESLPESSPTIIRFRSYAEQLGWKVEIVQEDVAPRIELPSSWDEYMMNLRKKDRHELRRKFRRLKQAGNVRQVELISPAEVENAMGDFIRLHRMSTAGKEQFMTSQRERFFRNVAVELAKDNLTRLCFLEVNNERVATSLSFVCKGVRYLYNSGYNPIHSNLSVGLLNHALAIKSSIESGHRVFDFMRGSEAYKYHLGGIDRQICAVTAFRQSDRMN